MRRYPSPATKWTSTCSAESVAATYAAISRLPRRIIPHAPDIRRRTPAWDRVLFTIVHPRGIVPYRGPSAYGGQVSGRQGMERYGTVYRGSPVARLGARGHPLGPLAAGLSSGERWAVYVVETAQGANYHTWCEDTGGRAIEYYPDLAETIRAGIRTARQRRYIGSCFRTRYHAVTVDDP